MINHGFWLLIMRVASSTKTWFLAPTGNSYHPIKKEVTLLFIGGLEISVSPKFNGGFAIKGCSTETRKLFCIFNAFSRWCLGNNRCAVVTFDAILLSKVYSRRPPICSSLYTHVFHFPLVLFFLFHRWSFLCKEKSENFFLFLPKFPNMHSVFRIFLSWNLPESISGF